MSFLNKKIIIITAFLLVLAFGLFFTIGKEGRKIDKEASLEDKIGQMIFFGFRGTDAPADSEIAKTIKDVKIGGVILFDYDVPSKSYPRNIVNPEQTKKLNSELQTHSEMPLLVAVDAEGGYVNRLKEKYGFLPIKSAKDMGLSDPAETKKEASKLADELKGLGFNMDLAPVIDVDINPENPVIGGIERSFSGDYNTVIVHAKAFIEAMHENGIVTSVKHFPGHGSSTNDSHLGLVDVTKTYKPAELIPYEKLQKEGILDTVMTAHIMNSNIDPDYPATLSPFFLQDILRKQIGFNGVIISDDVQMGAITSQYGMGDAVIRAINAGCDMIVASNNGASEYDPELAYKIKDIIFEAVKSGKISKEKIEESYDRIIELKLKYKIIKL